MAAAKRPAARTRAAGLPPITVGKFGEAMRLLERVVAEKRDVFLDAAAAYRDSHMDRMQRPLTAGEAAQIAAALAIDDDDPDRVRLAEQLQASGQLKAWDAPDAREVLLAAGASTAPEFLDAAKLFVALVEMAPDVFEDAREHDMLPDALEQAAKEMDGLPLAEARERATAAFGHFAAATGGGDDPGEAIRLVARSVMQAFTAALSAYGETITQSSSSLTGSLEPTDGTGGPSSTERAGARPSS